MDFGFLIPTHVCSLDSYKVFVECVVYLQTLYPLTPKIFFYDKEKSYDISKLDFMKDDKTISFETYRYCDGELNVYKHFYEHHYFDLAIILHDSMVLKKNFTNLDSIEDINFLWYFTNHRYQWVVNEEPKTEYNIEHKINNHQDLILHMINKSFNKENDFYKYAMDLYQRKFDWVGCYGSVSLIRYDFLKKLVEKTNLFNLIPNFKDKRDRMTLETIFSLACQYTLGKIPDTYDGLYYDGLFYHNQCETELIKKIHFYR